METLDRLRTAEIGPDDLCDVFDVMRILRVNHDTAYKHLRATGRAFKLGRLWRIRRRDLDAYVVSVESAA